MKQTLFGQLLIILSVLSSDLTVKSFLRNLEFIEIRISSESLFSELAGQFKTPDIFRSHSDIITDYFRP